MNDQPEVKGQPKQALPLVPPMALPTRTTVMALNMEDGTTAVLLAIANGGGIGFGVYSPADARGIAADLLQVAERAETGIMVPPQGIILPT